ncbi:MAG: 50S ribosomal protein L25 [Elusimicrobiaceae bacterium]|nr:50S ribosomal protein L25 [Elusimicrobiaceae bacterium]
METVKLSAEKRTCSGGKGALSKIRKDRKLPGIIYGGTEEPCSITFSGKELHNLMKHGANTIAEIEMADAKMNAIVQAVQYHPVTDMPIHVDFLRLSDTRKVEISVPVTLSGIPVGVKISGALVEHSIRRIQMRCLPKDIVKVINVDISGLEMGKAIYVRDLPLNEDVDVLTPGDRSVVHLVLPKNYEEEAKPAAAEGEAAAAAPAADGKAAPAADGKAAPAAAAKTQAKK